VNKRKEEMAFYLRKVKIYIERERARKQGLQNMPSQAGI
jgi:hypothetical protein